MGAKKGTKLTRPRKLALKDVDPSGALARSIINDPSELRAEQRRVWSDHVFTDDTAHRLVRSARRIGSDRKDALALASDRELIRNLGRMDALEELREGMGLSELKDMLMESLLEEASYEEGRSMLKEAVGISMKKGIADDELDMLLPDVTSLEIALFSLLKGVPSLYMQNVRLVHVFNITANGIEFAPDCLDERKLERDRFRADALDAYVGGGLTGITEGSEIVPFRDDVRRIVEKLVLLEITNRRLHESVFDESSLPTCFGLLMRTAFGNVCGEMPEHGRAAERQAGSLPDEQAAEYYAEYDRLQKALANATIFDVCLERTLEPFEVFKLVSILSRIPEPLQREGFAGYAVPYGLGVHFMGRDGQTLDYVGYRRLYAADAVHTVYYERQDVSRYNKTAHSIFGRFTRRLAESLEKGHIDGSVRPSQAEEAWMECFTQLKINLIVNPERDMEYDAYLENMFGMTINSHMSLCGGKFGADESRHIVNVLRMLPRHMLSGVREIAKEKSSYYIAESLLSGLQKVGAYAPGRKRITILEDPENPYKEYSRMERYAYSQTLLHEVGESVWASLPQERRDEFAAISGWTEEDGGYTRPPNPISEHFLTFYSHHANSPGDDFSEHFAIYVMHGSEFREKGHGHRALGRKYAFIRELFTLEDGQTLEYPQISDMSIREVHGKLRQEIKMRNAEEVMEAMEAMDSKLYEESRERISSIRKSLESMAEDELEQDDEPLDEANSPFFGICRRR